MFPRCIRTDLVKSVLDAFNPVSSIACSNVWLQASSVKHVPVDGVLCLKSLPANCELHTKYHQSRNPCEVYVQLVEGNSSVKTEVAEDLQHRSTNTQGTDVAACEASPGEHEG